MQIENFLQLKDIFDSMNNIVLQMDLRSNIIYFNRFAEKFFGFSKDEVLNKSVMETIVESHDSIGKNLDRMIKNILDSPEQYIKNENENICKDGNRVNVLWNNYSIIETDGDLQSVLSIGTPLSCEKEIQEIKQSQSRFERILRDIVIKFINADVSSFNEFIYSILQQISRYSYAEGAILFWKLPKNPDQEKISEQLFKLYIWQDRGSSLPITHVNFDYKSNWFINRLEQNKIFQINDIEELSENMENYRILGERYNFRSFLIVPIFDKNALAGALGVVMHTTPRIWMENDARILNLMGEIYVNAFKKKNLELRSQESDQAFRDIIEQFSNVTLRLSDNGIIELVNPACFSMFGYMPNELIGQHIFRFISAADLEKVKKILRSRQNSNQQRLTSEIEVLHKNGTYIPVEVNSVYLMHEGKQCVLVVLRDLSEHELHLQEEIRMQKIESIGLLAGGIAHDYNNLLAVILGNIEMLKFEENTHEEQEELLENLEKSVNQAKDLTQQLLTFSKGGTPVKKKASLKDIIRESIQFNFHGSPIDIQFDYEEIPPLDIDVSQIHQVLNNLIINAKQAISIPEKGKIIIRLENSIILNQTIIPLPDGQYIRIAIEDNGEGIPYEIQNKIFNPYFTTKSTGNGLGLATSFSIINRHRGHLTFYSIPNEGTTFEIYLPAENKNESLTGIEQLNNPALEKKLTNQTNPNNKMEIKSPQLAKISESKEKIQKLHGNILVMDDDHGIQIVLGKILDRLGLKHIATYNGKATISTFKQARDSGNPFDIVIMDLTIRGGMGGKETIKEIRKLNSSIPVIVSSGYSSDPVLAHYKDYGFSERLTKPFSIPKLYKVLKKILEK
ncbi:MAG: PAS domain S-box protein [Promethearchaeota archaeon]